MRSSMTDPLPMGDVPFPENEFFRGERRRLKAALVLAALWGLVALLHWFAWGRGLVLAIAAIAAIHAVRLLLARPPAEVTMGLSGLPEGEAWPSVAILVAAKDEEAVIGRLVRNLQDLDYPRDRLEIVIVDDASGDRTGAIVEAMAQTDGRVRLLRRSPGAGGGKSGALNDAAALTAGELLVVFDADAQVSPDLLRRAVPLFARSRLGAVQLRKAVVQVEGDDLGNLGESRDRYNFWLRGQQAEMALDCFLQQQRIALGGIGELRGNGEFVRREALTACGGFNEETITDDLDMTLRLHLAGWDIGCLTVPAVQEEGVTALAPLWHQRNRWAEGGYQRYLDYWRSLLANPLGASKRLDLLLFCMFQYLLPQATVPDTILSIARGEAPVLVPLVALGLTLSNASAFLGLRRAAIAAVNGPLPWRDRLRGWASAATLTALCSVYMLHWFVVIVFAGLRMAVRPKQLKWVKTVHGPAIVAES
jgi:1,2-diacylglycerol 3-beta-glucosyltransferase